MATNTTASPSRTWQDIARELAREMDHARIVELSAELDRALEKQGAQPYGSAAKSARDRLTTLTNEPNIELG